MLAVNRVSRALSMLLLSVWAVASMHCKLEALPGWEFLRFCHAEESPADHATGCAEDACAEIEDGNYRPEEPISPVPAPEFAAALIFLPRLLALPAPSRPPRPIAGSPPHLLASRHFADRSAPSPRAPSLDA